MNKALAIMLFVLAGAAQAAGGHSGLFAGGYVSDRCESGCAAAYSHRDALLGGVLGYTWGDTAQFGAEAMVTSDIATGNAYVGYAVAGYNFKLGYGAGLASKLKPQEFTGRAHVRTTGRSNLVFAEAARGMWFLRVADVSLRARTRFTPILGYDADDAPIYGPREAERQERSRVLAVIGARVTF